MSILALMPLFEYNEPALNHLKLMKMCLIPNVIYDILWLLAYSDGYMSMRRDVDDIYGFWQLLVYLVCLVNAIIKAVLFFMIKILKRNNKFISKFICAKLKNFHFIHIICNC